MITFSLITILVAVPVYLSNSLPEHVQLTESEFAQGHPIYLPKSKYLKQQTNHEARVGEDCERYVDMKLFGFIPVRRIKVDLLPFENVIAGGQLIGFNAKVDGIVITADAREQGLKKGDIIIEVNENPVNSVTDLEAFLATKTGRTVILVKLLRGGRAIELPLKVEDSSIGVWLKDETTGVGTLTYINPANNNFASLGHKMNDFETSTAVNLRGGTIHQTEILGVNKSKSKTAGSYKSILKNGIAGSDKKGEGDILSSNQFGVFGCLYTESILTQEQPTYSVSSRYNVRPGKAKIRTTLSDGTTCEFDCEIIKTRFQKKPTTKSMVIRITDKRLLESNGGIIHGMSGSPIIQNGKIVGALTHVVLGDASKGYGIYIDFVMPS